MDFAYYQDQIDPVDRRGGCPVAAPNPEDPPLIIRYPWWLNGLSGTNLCYHLILKSPLSDSCFRRLRHHFDDSVDGLRGTDHSPQLHYVTLGLLADMSAKAARRERDAAISASEQLHAHASRIGSDRLG
jgi:hypothetical protein